MNASIKAVIVALIAFVVLELCAFVFASPDTVAFYAYLGVPSFTFGVWSGSLWYYVTASETNLIIRTIRIPIAFFAALAVGFITLLAVWSLQYFI